MYQVDTKTGEIQKFEVVKRDDVQNEINGLLEIIASETERLNSIQADIDNHTAQLQALQGVLVEAKAIKP